ncbi:anti-sigma B factor RsbW [Cohnella soli]|uniref:Anti-sigma B factor RsbW n=1 Tax=Cohnella soli TaxID=425005 RepID=A0ABW0HWQ7_9BACL
MNAIRLQIPAHADYIDIVRINLYAIASKLGYSYEDIEDMKVAASEACNNAVLYGYHELNDDVIDICYEFDDTALSIYIKNKGPEFANPELHVQGEPLRQTAVSELPVGGLGIYLMEALMDEFDIRTKAGITEVVMTKYAKVKLEQ